MGSLFRPKVPAPPPPVEQKDPFNFRSDITNSERVIETAPDGTKTIVERALPLSEEDQAYKDKLKQIETDSLGWIEKLSTDFDRSQIPWLDNYLNDFEQTATLQIDKAFKARTDFEETGLARFGVEDSTAASSTREIRGKDFADSKVQLGRDLSNIEQNVRDKELSKATQLFGLASGRQDAQLSVISNTLGRGAQDQRAFASLDLSRRLGNRNVLVDFNRQKAQASAQGQATFGSLLGIGIGAATGGFGRSSSAGGGTTINWAGGGTSIYGR